MKMPPPAVEKVWNSTQLRWLSDELESPTCHSPYTNEDLENYLSGEMPAAQATSFERYLSRDTELMAFVDECQAGIPESVERVMRQVHTLMQSQSVESVLVPQLKLLDPPAKVMAVAGKVVWGVWSSEELRAVGSSMKTSSLVKEVEVRLPGISKVLRLGIYLSVTEKNSMNTHRFTVSLPRRMSATDLARLKNWLFFCGTLEIPLKSCCNMCDAATMESVLASSDMAFVPATI